MNALHNKCQAFSIRKQNDEYSQYTPATSSSNTLIPAVPVGGSFTRLGKLFNSNIYNEETKVLLKSKLDNLLLKVSSFAVKPQTKIKMLKLIIYPRISFELKSYNFSSTWIAGVLEGMVHTHIRRWLELPVRACIEEVACLSAKMYGLDIPSIRNYATNLGLTVRASLKLSVKSDTRKLWKETSAKNVEVNSTLNNTPALSSAMKVLHLRSH